jgi:hypothetical protein
VAEITVESAGVAYAVTVSEGGSSTRHTVTVEPDQLARLGSGGSAEDLIEASFRFLLDQEPKESIMGRFDLSIISRYFPDYESRIGDYL